MLIILTAIIVQTARWLSPSIHQFKDSIEHFASEQLHSTVSIDQISAVWVGLTPKIEVQGLSIRHQADFIASQSSNRNRNFLHIQSASLEVDILKSLFYRAPVWADVQARGLSAQLVQNTQGAWSLGDFASKNNTNVSNWRYRNPSSLFLAAQNVDLDDANLTLLFSDKRELTTHVPSISLKNSGYFHRIEASASISKGSSFQLIIEGVGDPSIPEQFFAKAYLKMEEFAEETLVQAFSQLTGIDLEQKWLQSSNADLELWFDFASTNRFLMNGHIALKNVESVIDELKSSRGNDWRADIIGHYRPATGLSIGVRNAVIDEAFNIPPFVVNLSKEKRLDIGIASIDVGLLNQWLVDRLLPLPFFSRGQFPRAKTKDILSSLDPKGSFHDVLINVDLLALENTTISGIASHVSVSSWKNIPAFSHVNGYLQSKLSSGFIVVDTEQFSLFPKAVYDQPVVANKATGLVGWEVDYNNKDVDIFGYNLSLQSDYGNANGNFLLNLNWRKEPDKNNLTLQLGLTNSKAQFHRQLVPRSLPTSLLSWMDSAIISGDLSHTGVLYRGGFTKGADRSVQVFVNVDQGRLLFDADWPEARAVNAELLIDNTRVFALVNSVSAYDDERFSGEVQWNEASNNTLFVDIAGDASSNSALKYINHSLLKDTLGDLVNRISSSDGDVEVSAKLAIIFDKAVVDAGSSNQAITVKFINNALTLDEQNLSFKEIKGSLYYSSKEGFSSKGLQANFLDQRASIKVYEDSQLPNTLFVSAKGQATVDAMNHWLEQPWLDYWQGRLHYNVAIQLPLNDSSKALPLLSLNSNLVGVSSHLPEPFKKDVSDKTLLNLTLPLVDGDPVFELSMGSYFTTKFSFVKSATNHQQLSGFFSVSDTVVSDELTLPRSGIKLLGKFKELQFDEWMAVFKSFSKTKGFTQSSKQSMSDTSLFLSINNLRFEDQILKNIIFSGERENNGWRVIADNKDVLGSLVISDDNQQPLLMEFDYINWPPNYSEQSIKVNADREPDRTKANDPLAAVDPSLLPKMSVNINRLNMFAKPLGHWSFDVLPDKGGVDFREIYGSVLGFKLKGINKGEGGFLRWNAGSEQSTSVYGSVVGKNPKVLFEQWGFPVVLESDKTKVDFDLSWLGSPLAVELESLNGSMAHHYEDGVFSQENIDSNSGVLRIFGLLNFDSWARRVRLDFSDVYKKGIIFDSLDGQLSFNRGIITLTEPLTMKGPSSQMTLSGAVDYPRQSVDANLEASLPIGGNLTMITALAAGLPVAAGVYIVSKIFKKQLNRVSSINYAISGNLNSPDVNVEKTKTEQEVITSPDNVYENNGS